MFKSMIIKKTVNKKRWDNWFIDSIHLIIDPTILFTCTNNERKGYNYWATRNSLTIRMSTFLQIDKCSMCCSVTNQWRWASIEVQIGLDPNEVCTIITSAGMNEIPCWCWNAGTILYQEQGQRGCWEKVLDESFICFCSFWQAWHVKHNFYIQMLSPAAQIYETRVCRNTRKARCSACVYMMVYWDLDPQNNGASTVGHTSSLRACFSGDGTTTWVWIDLVKHHPWSNSAS